MNLSAWSAVKSSPQCYNLVFSYRLQNSHLQMLSIWEKELLKNHQRIINTLDSVCKMSDVIRVLVFLLLFAIVLLLLSLLSYLSAFKQGQF